MVDITEGVELMIASTTRIPDVDFGTRLGQEKSTPDVSKRQKEQRIDRVGRKIEKQTMRNIRKGGSNTRTRCWLVGKRMRLVPDQEYLKTGVSLLYRCSRNDRGYEEVIA